MKWGIRQIATNEWLSETTFDQRGSAQTRLNTMGSAFSALYEVAPITNDPWLKRILVEGLVAGDLRRIVLPQISVDEYVPGDQATDNIVFAFFIKGVPAAVIPFRDFIMKCVGVVDVSYGDSDTVPNTSIVYAEMVRDKFRLEHLRDMMEQISILSNLEADDFSLMFPSSDQRYPYSEDTIQTYFDSRTRKKNWMAQKQAFDDDQTTDDDGVAAEKEQRESIIESLVSRM